MGDELSVENIEAAMQALRENDRMVVRPWILTKRQALAMGVKIEHWEAAHWASEEAGTKAFYKIVVGA